MKNREIVLKIVDILYNEGIDLCYVGNDINLTPFVTDSIQFVNFVLDLESQFGIEIPSELLSYDLLRSLHSLAFVIGELNGENQKKGEKKN